MPKPTKRQRKSEQDQVFQETRKAFLAHRYNFLRTVATADPSARLDLEIQYHQETLPQYRQIFLTVVRAEPSRRDELIQAFSDDTGGERLWLTDKGKRKQAIRVGKFIKSLDPRPERMSRKERQRQKKRQGKGLMNHQR